MFYFYRFLIVIIGISFVFSANWAEITGSVDQNVVIPASSVFKARSGSASVVIPKTPRPPGDKSGDTYDETIQEGGYTNDVFYSRGKQWYIYRSRIEKNQWGEDMPKIVSYAQWKLVTSNSYITLGLSYDDLVSCFVEEDIKTEIPYGNCTATKHIRRTPSWLPRRDAAAVYYKDYIYLMGGRGRGGEDIPKGWEYTHGGFYNGDFSGEHKIWREETRLLNDVWRSKDGRQWEIITQGCKVVTKELIYGPGDNTTQCRVNSDCKGNSHCGYYDNTTDTRQCVCNMWSKREGLFSIVYDGYIWVYGGMTQVQKHVCGNRTCGGDYRKYMNDIWRSENGHEWEYMGNGPWLPRAGHSVVIHNELLYLMGGITGDDDDVDNDHYLNDFWFSENGINWTQIITPHAYTPRAYFAAGSTYGFLVLAAGHTDNLKPLNDAWVWNSEDWVTDYGNDTFGEYYLAPYDDIERMQSLTTEEYNYLHSEGVNTIEQLATISLDKSNILKKRIPTICDEKNKAYRILRQCSLKKVGFDGESQQYWNAEVITDSYVSVNDYDIYEKQKRERLSFEMSDNECLITDEERDMYGLSPINDIKTTPIDTVCKWQFSSRSHVVGVVLNDDLYVIAGYKGHGLGPSDSVWYRQHKPPKGQFIKTPRNKHGDSVFQFKCDEDACLYEYRLWKMKNGKFDKFIRQWTVTTDTLDFGDWDLDRGDYHFEFRAIDASGNKDTCPEECILGRTYYEWTYVPPFPWWWILVAIAIVIVLLMLYYCYFRYRQRNEALQRYALRRLKPRFEKMQKEKGGDALDWDEFRDTAKEIAAEKLVDPAVEERRANALYDELTPEEIARRKEMEAREKMVIAKRTHPVLPLKIT